MRVGIADDSALIREKLQEIISASKEVEIVGALRNPKPSLTNVNIKMVGLNGLEVLTEISKENKSLHFINLTLHATEYYQQSVMESGADYFFSKVNDFEKIELAIDEMKET